MSELVSLVSPKRLLALCAALFVSALAHAHEHPAYAWAHTANFCSDTSFPSRPDWMKDLPDDLRISDICMPGTHDTLALTGPFIGSEIAKTQGMDLPEQLDAGIRALDIRLRLLGVNNESFLQIWHGEAEQPYFFENDVLKVLETFFAANPSETVVMRIKKEGADITPQPDTTFWSVLTDKLGDYSHIRYGPASTGYTTNPELGFEGSATGVRGKFIILDDYNDGALGPDYDDSEYHAPWWCVSSSAGPNPLFNIQDNYCFNDNWDLHDKWLTVKSHMMAATAAAESAPTPGPDQIYVNYLSGSMWASEVTDFLFFKGSFVDPYFVASGHSNPCTGAPRLATGCTDPTVFCGGYYEFPRVDCVNLGPFTGFQTICTIVFEGTNVMTYEYIAKELAAGNPVFTGIVMADFPGPGLIEKVIGLNPRLFEVDWLEGPYFTIQSAINLAQDGDTVQVRPGPYYENLDFQGKKIRVVSSHGPEETTIDGGNVGPVVAFVTGETAESVLEGFTITAGYATFGGGAVISGASPTIRNCVFEYNTADTSGGGISAVGSAVSVQECVFRENEVILGLGGAIGSSNSNPTIVDCSFDNNTAIGGKGGAISNTAVSPFLGTSATIERCQFTQNSSDQGGAIFNQNIDDAYVLNSSFVANAAGGVPGTGGAISSESSNVEVYNCTVTDNSASPGVGGAHSSGGWTNIFNSIFWDNGTQELGGQVAAGYSNIDGGWSGTGNFSADPLFVGEPLGGTLWDGPVQDELALGYGSPCIDAGSNDYASAVDLVGAPRLADDLPANTGFPVGAPVHVDMGALERQRPRQITVPEDLPTIQEAIDMVEPGGTVVVSPGTYFETIDFGGKDLTLRSAFGPDVTIIDGAGASTVVTCANGEFVNTVLDGFTITGGNAPSNGGGMNIVDSSPTITRCIFEGNSAATYGGGIYVASGQPTVTYTVFRQNSAWSGGGLWSWSSHPVKFASCVFSGNAVQNGGGGFTGVATATNCTFVGNTSPTTGAAAWPKEGSQLDNCAVLSNDIWTGTPTEVSVRHCVLPSAWTGAGGNNTVANPLFVDADGPDNVYGTADDDLRLSAGSPCIDAGDNDSVPEVVSPGGVTVDIDGMPRRSDDPGTPDTGAPFGEAPYVDIGAYEYPVAIQVPADYSSIQSAINAAPAGGTVIVAPGTYFGAIDFGGKVCVLRSSGGPDVTTIHGGGNSLHVVRFTSGETPETVLDGFTITGGNANFVYPDNHGGGIFIVESSPTVRNCRITGNNATYGGGAAVLAASAEFKSCRFDMNTAEHGGGLFSDFFGATTLLNCLFAANRADNDSFSTGGAAYGWHIAAINCTFAANHASWSGGAFDVGEDGLSTLDNCILWHNTPNTLYGSYNGFDAINYCVIEGGWSGLGGGAANGVGNVDLDPNFVDIYGPDNDMQTAGDNDYTLRLFSPAIDSGDSVIASAAGFTTDIDGLPRFSDDPTEPDAGIAAMGLARVDIGAHERPSPDTCDSAYWMGEGTNTFFCRTDGGLTVSGITPDCGGGPPVDAWFRWSPEWGGTWKFSTCLTADFDTRLALYDSCGGALLGCNDDDLPNCGPGYTSNLVVRGLNAGQEYWLQVGGYEQNVGGATVTISAEADDFDGDSFDASVDCDDDNPNIYPGAPEIYGNGIDEDCNGIDDPCPGIVTSGTGLLGDGVSLDVVADAEPFGYGYTVGGRVHSPAGAPDLWFQPGDTPTFPGGLSDFVEWFADFPWEGAVHGPDNWMKVIRDGDGCVSWARFEFDFSGSGPYLVAIHEYVRQPDCSDFTLDEAIAASQGTCVCFEEAAEVVRVGVPANPNAFLPSSTGPPMIGGLWTPRVDHSSFMPTAFADILFFSVVPISIDIGSFGTLLVAPPFLNFTPIVTAGSLFLIPIPDDCDLVGIPLSVQALSDNGPVKSLTNALDITIGSY